MRHKLTVLIVCGLAIALLVATQVEQRLTAQPQGGANKDRTPPEIKEGVKIRFIGAKAGAGVNRGEPATVVRVLGQWIYLQGKNLYLEEATEEREGWVNFDTVGWYKVVAK